MFNKTYFHLLCFLFLLPPPSLIHPSIPPSLLYSISICQDEASVLGSTCPRNEYTFACIRTLLWLCLPPAAPSTLINDPCVPLFTARTPACLHARTPAHCHVKYPNGRRCFRGFVYSPAKHKAAQVQADAARYVFLFIHFFNTRRCAVISAYEQIKTAVKMILDRSTIIPILTFLTITLSTLQSGIYPNRQNKKTVNLRTT